MSDQDKKRKLKQHKRLATGLFLLMAGIYALMVYWQNIASQSWMGYVKAFSEAAMVGALADWFAVTALFRHPLGLPIPHTNIIQRKKEDLGQNLGHFVNENFLSPTTIRPYVENINIVKIITNWLDKPKNQAGLEHELGELLKKIIEELNDEEVETLLTNKGTDLLQKIEYHKLLGKGLDYFIQKNEHIALLENLLPQIKTYISENDKLILKRIEDSRPFVALLAGKHITKEITEGLVAFVEEIQNDKNHIIRQKLTKSLQDFVKEVEHDPKWKEKLTVLKEELIVSENLKPYVQDLWKSLKNLIEEQVATPNSTFHHFIKQSIVRVNLNLKEDENLKERINRWIHLFLYRMILRNRNDIEDLISTTVAGWEAKELSEKLELEVGKDLQFIRVNGTLVGGLVGLLIYTITHFFLS